MIRELVNWVRNVYATPSAETMALRELEDCKRRLLEAQTAREYAESMCKYREAQIKRLTAYLHKATEEQS
jgi:transposase